MATGSRVDGATPNSFDNRLPALLRNCFGHTHAGSVVVRRFLPNRGNAVIPTPSVGDDALTLQADPRRRHT